MPGFLAPAAVERDPDRIYDLAVIGGGINGAGIARDAAGRGLSVALIEAGDLGGATSSASTKLIHGGLRYLEFYEFRLVAKALAEREVILANAPQISWPQSFVLPYEAHLRPRWLIRAGLFLYDHLARRKQVAGSSSIDLRRDVGGRALDPSFLKGFRFWDGWIDDARLVVLNAADAAAKGAMVLTRTRVVRGTRGDGVWELELATDAPSTTPSAGRGPPPPSATGEEPRSSPAQRGRGTAEGGGGGSRTAVRARRIVNAAGPWADVVAREVLGLNDAPQLRLVQGAHIVTRKVNGSDDAYMLQQPDGRIVFVIPYERDYSLIGTTETPIERPEDAGATQAEVGYLLGAVNRYLARPVSEADIVRRFAGVRPLVLERDKDARETTRDWRFVAHDSGVLTVVGGKITTYRRLAEAALKIVAPKTRCWTAGAPLPGGDVPRERGETGQAAFARWLEALKLRHRLYDPALIDRLARIHGTAAEGLLADGLGDNLGGIFTAELARFVTAEWATTAEDVLWRRTKLGLHLDAGAQARVADWFAARFTKV